MENVLDTYNDYSKDELSKLLKNQVKSIAKLEVKTVKLESEKDKLESEKDKLEVKTVKLESEKDKLESEKDKLEQQVSYLKFQLEQFKRAMFGSKRERFISLEIPGQFLLPFDVNEQEVLEAVEVVVEQISYQRKKAEKTPHQGRLALPSHLPVNEIVLEPTENVEGLKCIGQEITDELEYTPGKLFINRFIRNKYITEENQEANQEVRIASLDFRPIPKCIAGPNLLAQTIIDKFVDHLPLYRQLQRYSREGVDIASSTMESWIKLTSNLLHPLYECNKQYTILNGYLQVDESPIRVQDKEKKGSTHTGFMWVYYAPLLKSVYFDYQKGRGAESPLEMIGEYEGYLQTDGYAVYKKYGDKQTVTALGCWAHVRRYFEKALNYNKSKASHVMLLIQKLYEIERRATLLNLPPEERQILRLEESFTILNEIGSYIALQSKTEIPKSPLGKAYDYCLNRWDSLMNYIKDGNLQIDNNLVENAIRPLALGRKNYLFAGSHDAAKNIAMYYSFMATCKKNNINPQHWLQYVLKNINQTKISDLKDLLPQFINPGLLRKS